MLMRQIWLSLIEVLFCSVECKAVCMQVAAIYSVCFITAACHHSSNVYNSIKWDQKCIINAFFESHRAHFSERRREAGSVGRKDVPHPSSPPSLSLYVLPNWGDCHFRGNVLYFCCFFFSTDTFFKCLPFFFSCLLPSHLCPDVQSIFFCKMIPKTWTQFIHCTQVVSWSIFSQREQE